MSQQTTKAKGKNNCDIKYHSKDMCVKCYNKDYAYRNKEAANKRAKDWYLNNKDTKIKYDLEYNKANRDRKNAQSLSWTKNNHYKRVAIRKKSYYKNRNRSFANAAARRARILNAMPKWLSIEQRRKISDIYANRPAGHHVDHIEPLKGKDRCGLHVPWNLQYLPAQENFKKGNKCG